LRIKKQITYLILLEHDDDDDDDDDDLNLRFITEFTTDRFPSQINPVQANRPQS
jgi:hypothetical protein